MNTLQKSLLLLFLFLFGIFPITQSQEKPSPSFFHISPVPQNIPVKITISAKNKGGDILKDFNETVRFRGIIIYEMIQEEIVVGKSKAKRVVEKVYSDKILTFKEGVVSLNKAKIRNKNITSLFANKKIEVKSSFYKVCFHSPKIPKNVPTTVVIKAIDKEGNVLQHFDKAVTIKGLIRYLKKDKKEFKDSKPFTANFTKGLLTFKRAEVGNTPLKTLYEKEQTNVTIFTYSPWLTIIPPLLAIILAIVTKEVLISLFVGIWAGVFVLSGYQPFGSFFLVIESYIIPTIGNKYDYVPVLVFSLTIGGMIGIIANSGGIHDMVEKISKYAKSPKSGMISTWCMGIMIFFDDYANSLLVGNSMRPITDRLKISREKLAYIVDSTAAPVTCIAFISTWIGTELGYIAGALHNYDQGKRAFEYFIASIPYHFYSLFAIGFVFLIAYMGRDFGAMYKAEKRARTTGKVLDDNANPLTSDEISDLTAPEGKPCRWYNALIPILTVIFVTLFGLYYSGYKSIDNPSTANLREIIQAADSFEALLWAAVLGSVVAGILAISQKILTISETLAAWVKGLKSMLLAMLVLILAWTLKDLCASMQTNKFIFHETKDLLSVNFLPVLSFIIAAGVAFATGTSWGTMGLLFPFILPLAIELSSKQLPLDTSNYIFLGTMGSILAGASFGDHCSPISDTTVMSSMACSCDHVDHVKTQMPYALTTAAVSCLFGYLPVGFGLSPWISLLLGTAAMVFIIFKFGKKV